jgi:hypothetical protein
MKNYQELLRRVATWLRPEGLCFIHIFTHLYFAYHFEVRGLPASSRLDASVSLQVPLPSKSLFQKQSLSLHLDLRDAPFACSGCETNQRGHKTASPIAPFETLKIVWPKVGQSTSIHKECN